VKATMVAENSALQKSLPGISSQKPSQHWAYIMLVFVLASLAHASVRAQYAAGVATAPPVGGPSGIRVRSSLTVSEVFSDNVSLAASGSERSEWTTRIRPSVTITEQGPRLRFNATYSPELLYRANQGTTDISHFLDANGNAELVHRLLYLDVKAGVSQQNVSLLATQSDSNLNTTSNRTSVKSYGISPYLRHNFGADASSELRYTHDAVHYGANSNGASASTSDRIDAKLSSGASFQLFTWGLVYSKSHVEYSQTGQKVDAESYSATGGRLVYPNLRLTGNVGFEDSGYPTTSGQANKGPFWNVGPTWTPSPRTTVSASLGRRYYGASKTFNFEHRSRMTLSQVNYSESVTTTRSTVTGSNSLGLDANAIDLFVRAQFPNDPNGVEANNLRDSLSRSIQPVNFLTDALFLDKRWQATFAIQGLRNTIVTSLFSSNRDSLSTSASTAGDFNVSQNVKQTGASLTWSTRVTQTLGANASAGLTRNRFTSTGGGSDRLSYLRFGVTEQFSPKLTGSLLVGRQQNDTNRIGGSKYTENSVSATLGLKY
jgi:uncharacterized protein (PEP-CTERM system associated)